MKITDAKTFVVAVPPPHFGGPYWIFVKLTTDSGMAGYGEVYSVPFHPHVVAKMIEDVCARQVIGADPFQIERLWRIVYSSGYTQRPDTSLVGILSGIEMACWDIVGKETNRPVYDLLGGRVHERLRSYTYLYPEAIRPDQRVPRPRPGPPARRRIREARLHRRQVRPGDPLLRLRPAPTVAGGARPGRALCQKIREAVGGQAAICCSARTGR